MKVLNQDEVGSKTNGSSLKGYIYITYPRLISILGEPTYSTESGDGKVQKEWVVEYKGNIFTIYDWKTFDVEYTMNELDEFHVGGITQAYDFIEDLSDKNKG
jgi:hypothetical protein